jgi:DNA-binding transcriptional ArsR family regulator
VPEPLADVVELTDAKAIRAIAHPARLVIIDALYDQGVELTATQAAALAGTTPSAMSYHLRALERYGIVRRADAGHDARERPWVRAAKDLRIRPPAPASSRAVAVATSAVLATALDVTRQKLLAAVERSVLKGSEMLPLDEVTGFMHTALLVNPDEARGVLEGLNELIEPWRVENRTDAPADAGRLTLVIASMSDVEMGSLGIPDERS